MQNSRTHTRFAHQNESLEDKLIMQAGPRGYSCGFAILELLLSMLVLAMLVVVVSSITNATACAGKISKHRMDAENHARLVFDRMANDFSKMIRRNDADCLFFKNSANNSKGNCSGNDVMFFYSEAPAYYEVTGTSRSKKNSVALIGYRISSSNPAYPNTPVLERLGMGLTWDGAGDGIAPGGPIFLSPFANSSVPDPATTLEGNWKNTIGTAASGYSDGINVDAYHVLGNLVYRMEIQFLLTDGTLSNTPITNPEPASGNNLSASFPPTLYSDSNSNFVPGSRWFDSNAGKGYICTSAAAGSATWTFIGVRDVSAIVLTLAILDDKSRKIITGAISGLPLCDAADASPVQPVATSWKASVNNSADFAAASGIPNAAASQVRIFQRTFYLACP